MAHLDNLVQGKMFEIGCNKSYGQILTELHGLTSHNHFTPGDSVTPQRAVKLIEKATESAMQADIIAAKKYEVFGVK